MMRRESNYSEGSFANPLVKLEDNTILKIVRLSCASNDLTSNHEAIKAFPKGENGYFFFNSISIVREVAKLVKEIANSDIRQLFSDNTEACFKKLETRLIPFDNESLSRSVLKPIRDSNFHYTFPEASSNERVSELLVELRESKELDVGVLPEENHLMSIRYTFAERFRNEYINSHLDNDIVMIVSEVTVGIIEFLDTLFDDLMEANAE